MDVLTTDEGVPCLWEFYTFLFFACRVFVVVCIFNGIGGMGMGV
jgi:hypothetical protein